MYALRYALNLAVWRYFLRYALYAGVRIYALIRALYFGVWLYGFPVRPLMRLVLRRLAMRPIIRLHPRLIFTCFPSRLMFRRMIAQRIVRLVVRLAALSRTSLYMPARLKRPFTYYTNHVIRIRFHFCYSCGQKIKSYYFSEVISSYECLQIPATQMITAFAIPSSPCYFPM